ncbi:MULTISPECIES: ankyrin repeat domain-containing protein [unclassified Wolbachia]|uniref:ankyrin repeat domain-containing protein n=1 Tax=unclassified Wolbachia TaxID=2640676 RepID=UPI002100731A|nr:ankyrin repeat domain-containing protein [Wolbachia endosymbiont of Drosophila simulans]
MVAGAEVNAVDEGEKAFSRLSALSNTRERGVVEAANIQQLRLTPLHYAVLSGREMVELLIEKGANINMVSEDGPTLLHYAAAFSDKREVVELLIKEGANVDAVDDNGNTPLFSAALSGKREMVELLIEKRANVDAVNKVKNTPLHAAALSGKREVVELLIGEGAHIDAIDDNGNTPLSWAAEHSQKGVIESLLEKGANIDVIDGDGNTSLNCVIISNKIDNAELIVNHIAKLEATGLYVSPENIQLKAQIMPEIEKRIFLHNHKPLIDALSTHYGSNFQAMTFTGIKNRSTK